MKNRPHPLAATLHRSGRWRAECASGLCIADAAAHWRRLQPSDRRRLVAALASPVGGAPAAGVARRRLARAPSRGPTAGARSRFPPARTLPVVARHAGRIRHQPRRAAGHGAPRARRFACTATPCCRPAVARQRRRHRRDALGARSRDARTSRCASMRSRRAATTSATRFGRRRSVAPRRRRRRRTRSRLARPRRAARSSARWSAARRARSIGTAVGGGAGTAVVLSTRGKEVHLAEGRRADAAADARRSRCDVRG